MLQATPEQMQELHRLQDEHSVLAAAYFDSLRKLQAFRDQLTAPRPEPDHPERRIGDR